jgi:hypothetical protein
MAGAPLRRSDLDFADVFGGPPRRVSGNEHRSQRGSQDTSSFESATRAGSGGPDTPVFGDRGSSDRRRQLGEEFYKDIFPGSEAASPRRSGAGDWGNVFGAQASPVSTARPRSRYSQRAFQQSDIKLATADLKVPHSISVLKLKAAICKVVVLNLKSATFGVSCL